MTTPSTHPDPINYNVQAPNQQRRANRANRTDEVAAMLAEGKTLQQIAVATGLSVPTLTNYRTRIRREAKLKAMYG